MTKKTASKTSSKSKKPQQALRAVPVQKKTAAQKSKPAAKKAVKPAPKKAQPAKKAASKISSKKTAPSKAPKSKINLKKPAAKKAAKPLPRQSGKAKPVKKIVKKSETPTVKISKKTKPAPAAPKKAPPSKASKPAAAKKAAAQPKKPEPKSAPKRVEKTPSPAPKKIEKPSTKKIEEKKEAPARGSKAKKKVQHARPSSNIAFSLEDLDAFFERKSSGASPAPAASSAKAGKGGEVRKAEVSKTAQAKLQKPTAVASIFDILGYNPVAPTREKVESLEVPKKWKKYYTRLMEMRKEHSRGIESRVEEVHKRSSKEDSGDLSSYGQHLADAGSESFERDMAYNILASEKEFISEIDAAVKRMKDGTYGICEVTGKPIPEDRLWSIPHTRYTKEGQERKEAESRYIKAMQRSTYEMPGEGGGSSSGEEEDTSA